jgi:hypothetical protein
MTEALDERIEDSLPLGGDAILTSAPHTRRRLWEHSAYDLT